MTTDEQLRAAQTERIRFPLPASGADAVIAALHDHRQDLPVFVYERLDPVTRRPTTTWIGIRVSSARGDQHQDPFAEVRARTAASGAPDSGGGVLAFVAHPAPEGSSAQGRAGAPGTPAAVSLTFREYVRLDHEAGIGEVVRVPEGADEAAPEEAADPLAFWAALCAQSAVTDFAVPDPTSQEEEFAWRPAVSLEEYSRGVDEFHALGAASPVEGVVLSVPVVSDVPADPVASYRALRAANPSTCMFLLRDADFSLWGATSLPLVEVRGGRLLAETDGATRPFPGIAPGEQPLWEPTAKEVAEYDVVARALEDDLGAVSAPGTLRLTREQEQRTFFGLGHLFAEMQADVADDVDSVDVVKALFPHGAAVGHPRRGALELIGSLEPRPRGPFAGAIGVFGADGGADVAAVTRSMWTTSEGSCTQAGAKVVAQSVAHEEYEESVLKTTALRITARAADPRR